VEKPKAMSSEGWSDWEARAMTGNRFAYWIADTFLDKVQNFVNYPSDEVRAVRVYLHNRFVTKTHYLKTKLKPGQWYEFEDRLMHAMFEELVDFVEVEQAWHQCVWNKQAWAKYMPTYWKRIRGWRSPEAGLAHLQWESKLVYNGDSGWHPQHESYGQPTDQAIRAIEQIKIYDWWKNIRPNRPNPYDVSGWSDICARRKAAGGMMAILRSDQSDEEKAQSRHALDMIQKLESQYDQEDTDMMVALVKIRKGMWT
jgi:hypothetical protein